MWPNRIRSAFLTLAFTALLSGSAAFATAPVCADDLVLLQGDSAPLKIRVEIADDAASRAQGLMFRRSLPRGQGMLFVYPRPAPLFFWMRNTFIPLDIVFIDDRGVIRHIHPQARPLDETPIPGAAPGDPDPERLMVLEIGGGEAARLGLRVGQALAHPRLDAARAAWPCR
ncbi:DUF192 domain-containing protein [Paracoccus siganidrum]|uniref:DUF192 domain-containing protein n=1 Tax=Paracoccus siganidrum TaxID=1276757 RepID=A0A419ABQ4_9RHOB|nr:DUF192 domain-containing protein [Paracoccus siganidrum]RJL21183.1 DUF192 domain-containing protein [Paracoccus siganidrum]RMC40531.1 DUF192 domain-containing protein [Paracoccus siganidrum]